MSNNKLVFVSEEEGRLDVVLSKKLDISRSLASKIISNGCKVNSKEVSKAGTFIKVGDSIEYEKLVLQEDKLIENDIPLDIVYEDDYLLVINKQRGLVVHPSCGHNDNTLVNSLLFNKKLKNFDSEFFSDLRPGIVHRIDKDTSGLLIVAKTLKAMNLLQEMIKEHEVEREYYCIVYGRCPYKTFTIDIPLTKPNAREQKAKVNVKEGRQAVTHFTCLATNNDYSLLHCKLETGRTHQIRASLDYYNMPIVNDPIYNLKKNLKDVDLRGQLLHAYKLTFTHPISKKEIVLKAPFDSYFKEYLVKCFPNQQIDLEI